MLDRLRSLLDWLAKPAPRASAEKPLTRTAPGSIPLADLDPDAVKIVRRLLGHKHRAYLVGGCVRDLLLGRKPKDFDIGTSATPGQIKRLFRNCRIIGRRFRLAHIYFHGGKVIEVATFRSRESDDDEDSAGKDLLIRDDNVFGTPAEDAQRRDFTINALFYDIAEEKVIDHTGGLDDLNRRLIRTIGDPGVRFREDPIRMLRAVKFAARLDLVIEKNTMAALMEHRHDLDKAAMPRVLEEINRFCREGSVRRSFEMLFETGLFDVIFPEVAAAYRKDPKARELLLSLIHPMDPRSHQEVHVGEFFAALLLPLLIPDFGWKANGTTERTPGFNMRSHVDDLLRPLALRLRIPRREQEYCRQMLGTLFRMVPHDRVRPQAKQAILRRECLTDAVRAMGLLGKLWGGEFAAAERFWSSQEKVPSVPRHDGEPSDDGDDSGERAPRRRRRRGGRRRSERGGSAPRTSPPSTPARSSNPPARSGAAPTRPPRPRGGPRDDNSFFAALPSLPDDDDDDDIGDRYGALDVAPRPTRTDVDDNDNDDRAAESETGASGERRPRRRRRGRRRGRRTESTASGGEGQESTADDPAADDGEE